MTDLKERVGVIGAGPAGLAAAYMLGKRGIPVDVFEAGPSVGGMAKTFSLWGQKVDLGPHRFFSADARVNQLWLDVVGTDYRMVERQTRIYYGGQFFDYPLQIADALSKLGPAEAARCVLSYLRQQFRREPSTGSFEHWVRSRFGQRLYEIFFRAYSEKLWGIPCTELDADFASQRIRKLSFYGAVINALKQGHGNNHATLVDRFAYPLDGTGHVYKNMAEAVTANRGSINLTTPVRRVVPGQSGWHALELSSGESRSYRHIISTMPLTHLVRRLPDAPERVLEAASKLRFRNTVMVYLRVEAQDLFPDQWIYVHAPELEIGRITNFRNWVPTLHGDQDDTILCLELWCDPDDERWNASNEDFVKRATRDLHRTGLIQDARITDSHIVKVPYCYPVYDLGYKKRVDVVKDYLNTIPGLDVIGRYGSFKYNNQDHSLLMGILAADNIANERSHDLWSINADDEYQEASIISETGLVPQPG